MGEYHNYSKIKAYKIGMFNNIAFICLSWDGRVLSARYPRPPPTCPREEDRVVNPALCGATVRASATARKAR